jgi:hypothetical protein
VTGINALRIYNVTKQGKDQDAGGAFQPRVALPFYGIVGWHLLPFLRVCSGVN